jgi:hypothetical protein
MKKVLTIVSVFAAAAVLFLACGKTEKYTDVKPVVDEMTSAFQEFNKDAAAVKESKDLITAFESLGGKLVKIAPQMKALQQKYPEMKSGEKDAPAELKPSLEQLEASLNSIQKTMTDGKLIKYMTDPEVMKAAEKFQKSMMMLGE